MTESSEKRSVLNLLANYSLKGLFNIVKEPFYPKIC